MIVEYEMVTDPGWPGLASETEIPAQSPGWGDVAARSPLVSPATLSSARDVNTAGVVEDPATKSEPFTSS
jgi:hypothetical protein